MFALVFVLIYRQITITVANALLAALLVRFVPPVNVLSPAKAVLAIALISVSIYRLTTLTVVYVELHVPQDGDVPPVNVPSLDIVVLAIAPISVLISNQATQTAELVAKPVVQTKLVSMDLVLRFAKAVKLSVLIHA